MAENQRDFFSFQNSERITFAKNVVPVGTVLHCTAIFILIRSHSHNSRLAPDLRLSAQICG